MSATKIARRIGRGFTLVELLVVIAIIILLVGILLPALNAARDRAKEASVQIQLESISDACESYEFTYNAYPGYFTEKEIADTINGEFSGTENLVVSLMGYVVQRNNRYQPTGSSMAGSSESIHLDKVGDGPVTKQGEAHAPFYSPNARELDTIGGDPAMEQGMPELVDVWQGMPILYFRANPNGTIPVSADSSGSGVYYRNANAKYFTAAELTNADEDTYLQDTLSLLSPNGGGNATNADNNLAWATINRKLSTVPTSGAANGDANEANDVANGGFVLMTAGKDGTYFDKDSLPNGTSFNEFSEVDDMDDTVVFGGNR